MLCSGPSYYCYFSHVFPVSFRSSNLRFYCFCTFDVSANLIEGPIPQTVALSTGLGECSHYSHITGHFGPPILSNSHTFQTYPWLKIHPLFNTTSIIFSHVGFITKCIQWHDSSFTGKSDIAWWVSHIFSFSNAGSFCFTMNRMERIHSNDRTISFFIIKRLSLSSP